MNNFIKNSTKTIFSFFSNQKVQFRNLHNETPSELQNWINQIQKRKDYQKDTVSISPIVNLNLTLDRNESIPKIGGNLIFILK